MIQARELRIGNYLFDSLEDSGVIQITEIKQMTPNKIGNMSISYYGVNGGYCTTSLEENITDNEIEDYVIQPIPLTEEWLLKFGFIKNTYPNLHWFKCLDNGDKLSITEHKQYGSNKHLSFYFNCGGYSSIDLQLINVHQLQNLYFALTNEELTFKP
jgi:hypothetical protein